MKIYKKVENQNGAITFYHVLWNVEIVDGVLYAIVDSYRDNISKNITWRDKYALPTLTLELPDVRISIINCLITTPGVFINGTIVEDEPTT